MRRKLLLFLFGVSMAFDGVRAAQSLVMTPVHNQTKCDFDKGLQWFREIREPGTAPGQNSTRPLAFTMPTHPPQADLAFTMPTHPPQADLAFTMPTHPAQEPALA
jgi:hypothetical protein